MGIAGDPWFSWGEREDRQNPLREEWFERILRAGREAAQAKEVVRKAEERD